MEAEPLPMPAIDEAALAELEALADTQAEAAGPAEMVAGSEPGPGMDALAQELYAEEWAAIDAGGVSLEELAPAPEDGLLAAPKYKAWYVNYNKTNWKKYPHTAMGRLFFRVPGEGTASCSGSVAVGRSIWTAGHCVYTTGRGWHTNMIFVPAYRNGNAPYGKFKVSDSATFKGWMSGGRNAFAYDIGMVVVKNRSGKKISKWVGSLGAAFNQSRKQLFHSFGYPGNVSKGRYLVACKGRTSAIKRSYNPDVFGMGCVMEQGSSGGPWLLKYKINKAGKVNYINGVVSHGRPGSEEFFSPYFGKAARDMYKWGKKQ